MKMRSRKSYRRLLKTMTAVRGNGDAVKKNIPEVAGNNDRSEEI